MRALTSLTTVAVLACMAVPQNSEAAFVGMSVDTFQVHTSGGLNGLTTYRVYADFSAPGDFLNSVGGTFVNPMSISSTTGTFYQDAFGGATSQNINPAFIPLFPDLTYDSWLTIGLENQTGNALATVPTFGADISPWDPGTGNVGPLDNTGIFITPSDPQGSAGGYPGLRVLVAQLTTNGDVSGSFDIFWSNGGASPVSARGDFNSVPEPTPALLLVAGIGMTSLFRRRR